MKTSKYEDIIAVHGDLPEYKFNFILIIDGELYVNSLTCFYVGWDSRNHLFVKLENSHITHGVSIVLLYQYMKFDTLIIFSDMFALRKF